VHERVILNWIKEFEAITAVVINGSMFWNKTRCGPLKVNRHFGGTCRLHLQGWGVSQVTSFASRGFHSDLLLGVFFNLENGCGMFLPNIGWLSMDLQGVISQKNTSGSKK
jgi:hypothetical protein